MKILRCVGSVCLAMCGMAPEGRAEESAAGVSEVVTASSVVVSAVQDRSLRLLVPYVALNQLKRWGCCVVAVGDVCVQSLLRESCLWSSPDHYFRTLHMSSLMEIRGALGLSGSRDPFILGPRNQATIVIEGATPQVIVRQLLTPERGETEVADDDQGLQRCIPNSLLLDWRRGVTTVDCVICLRGVMCVMMSGHSFHSLSWLLVGGPLFLVLDRKYSSALILQNERMTDHRVSNLNTDMLQCLAETSTPGGQESDELKDLVHQRLLSAHWMIETSMLSFEAQMAESLDCPVLPVHSQANEGVD